MSTINKLSPVHVVAARGLLKMSQQDLATAAEVSQATIAKFEAGLHDPRPATMKAIRTALEEHGIEFYNGGDPGVRLFRSKAKKPGPH